MPKYCLETDMNPQDHINIAHRANRNFVLNCVLKEVNLGLRFCQIMRSNSAPADVFVQGEHRAQLALRCAEEYMWKMPIAHPKFDQLTSQVERLRFELNNLEGEKSQPSSDQKSQRHIEITNVEIGN